MFSIELFLSSSFRFERLTRIVRIARQSDRARLFRRGRRDGQSLDRGRQGRLVFRVDDDFWVLWHRPSLQRSLVRDRQRGYAVQDRHIEKSVSLVVSSTTRCLGCVVVIVVGFSSSQLVLILVQAPNRSSPTELIDGRSCRGEQRRVDECGRKEMSFARVESEIFQPPDVFRSGVREVSLDVIF